MEYNVIKIIDGLLISNATTLEVHWSVTLRINNS